MNPGVHAALLAGVLLAAAPLCGTAQEQSEWDGTLERPNMKVKNVKFIVTRTGEKTDGMAMRHEGTLYEFKNIVEEDGRITFSWTPGNAGDIQCIMVLDDDGVYRGSCPLAESNAELGMTMLPKTAGD